MQDGTEKPVAANIDRIFIVSAIRPEPSMHLIDRYLVVAEWLQLEPVIVINKIDLLEGKQEPALKQALSVYESLGYQLIYSSTRLDTGLEKIKQSLHDHTSIMVGQSGVGKSSLIKCLLPDIDIRIGELTEIEQGRHTTTSSSLYHLPDGGDLIDSPGVRDFAVWNLQADDIVYGFREFRPYIGHCKFRNCTHHNEPGCAIREAADAGKIERRRFDSYRQMIEERDSRKS
jgi:ribosome biogenesis GTPase